MTGETNHQRKLRQRGIKRDRGYEAHVRKQRAHLRHAKYLRGTYEWQQLREAKLTADPLCAACLEATPARTTLAMQVDHVQPLETHPHLWNVWSNLASLCTRCHARKSQAERGRGKGRP